MSNTVEINFDGLVGPTHNFAGLSHGNIASADHAAETSNPKEAALQGLKKMRTLSQMGLAQGILPPQERPHIPTLKALGFSGSDATILASAQKIAPQLLASTASASCMWVANAATVSPAADTTDGRTHFTPANLSAMLHRSIEHPTTGRILNRIFSHNDFFCHHPALPAGQHFGDEGAANHTRLCSDHGDAGIEIFVYGASALNKLAPRPKKFPARQSLEASMAIARLHGLTKDHCIFAQQNPDIIDAGAFHNDVIAVGSKNCLFYHQDAFLDIGSLKKEIDQKLPGDLIHFIEIPRNEVSASDALSSYLFNTQLVEKGLQGDLQLIAPIECQENDRVHRYLDKLMTLDTPIKGVTYLDVRESMKNGGGPACLRLRVVLSASARDSILPRVLMTDELYDDLVSWVSKHYRDKLSPSDLADPLLLNESRTALDELTQILKLGSVYEFQSS